MCKQKMKGALAARIFYTFRRPWHHICTCNLLVWKWIDETFDIKWMYLLCFTFADTAFLLCGAGVAWIADRIARSPLEEEKSNHKGHFVDDFIDDRLPKKIQDLSTDGHSDDMRDDYRYWHVWHAIISFFSSFSPLLFPFISLVLYSYCLRIIMHGLVRRGFNLLSK